jgi:hypothetical protein
MVCGVVNEGGGLGGIWWVRFGFLCSVSMERAAMFGSMAV